MKIAFRARYGPPEVLSIKEVETPGPKDNELLIKVYAATVNRSDYHILTGKPFFMRLFIGLFKPKLPTTGTDFAGQIEAIGKNVTSFKVGDNVMGFDGGLFGIESHAQYLLLPETKAIKITVHIAKNNIFNPYFIIVAIPIDPLPACNPNAVETYSIKAGGWPKASVVILANSSAFSGTPAWTIQ